MHAVLAMTAHLVSVSVTRESVLGVVINPVLASNLYDLNPAIVSWSSVSFMRPSKWASWQNVALQLNCSSSGVSVLPFFLLLACSCLYCGLLESLVLPAGLFLMPARMVLAFLATLVIAQYPLVPSALCCSFICTLN